MHDDVLDEALTEIARHGRELRNGFTSHAPMVAETLCALGRADAVLPWLAGARADFRPPEAPHAPIADGASALGVRREYADWCAWFEAELGAEPWRALLARWLPRVAPAACADATHGLIRTAHAARALARRETPERRRELAHGLAAWAATYQTLPVAHTRRTGHLAPTEAARALPLQPAAERGFRGSIVSALAGLASFSAFEPVIDWLDPDADLSDVTRTFARLYLANARDPLTTITFVHGVTSTAALRALLPHLAPEPARELVRFAWQAGAGLYASLGHTPPLAEPLAADGIDRAALIEAAVVHGDDHVIKLVEACLAEHALAPDPVFLHAARHVLGALPSARR